jgi:cell division protease FtsH
MVEKSFDGTVSILQKHRDMLDQSAKLLLEKETLDEAQLRSIADKLLPPDRENAAALAPGTAITASTS